jgi:hydrogenase maturation protease
MSNRKKILFFGYGNLGRQDDGLGVRLAEKLEANEDFCQKHNVDVDANYQLNVEDALLISEYDLVVFADASLKAQAPCQWEKLQPAAEIQFTTHAMHPASVLSLCHDLYKKEPETYLLTMPGVEWELSEEMSEQAKSYLEETYQFVLKKISNEANE